MSGQFFTKADAGRILKFHAGTPLQTAESALNYAVALMNKGHHSEIEAEFVTAWRKRNRTSTSEKKLKTGHSADGRTVVTGIGNRNSGRTHEATTDYTNYARAYRRISVPHEAVRHSIADQPDSLSLRGDDPASPVCW